MARVCLPPRQSARAAPGAVAPQRGLPTVVQGAARYANARHSRQRGRGRSLARGNRVTQAFRLPTGGIIDRSRPLRFEFDGTAYEGYAGDTLASALLANGVHLVAPRCRKATEDRDKIRGEECFLKVEPLRWSKDHQEWSIDGTAFPERFRQKDRWVLPLPSTHCF